MVKLWFNLHRKDWSFQTGKEPVQHATAVVLADVSFRVCESGRLRVVAKKCREVHARAYGTLCDPADAVPVGAVEVSYNPYRGGQFYRKDTGADVLGASLVYFVQGGKAYAVNPS